MMLIFGFRLIWVCVKLDGTDVKRANEVNVGPLNHVNSRSPTFSKADVEYTDKTI